MTTRDPALSVDPGPGTDQDAAPDAATSLQPARLRLAGHHPAGGGAGGVPPGRDDPGGEGCATGQPLGRQRQSGRGDGASGRRGRRARVTQRGSDGGPVHRDRVAAAGRGRPARVGPPDPGLRQRAAERGRRGGRGGAPAAGRGLVVAVGRAGAGARGVPDRLHQLRRHGLSGGDRLGGDLRPGAGRADGGGDRPRHGRARGASGPVAGARRGPRLPVGPGRGDDRRGPVPGLHPGQCVRAGPAERRHPRHPEALRRVLGLARRPQPRAGADGPAGTDGRHPAAVRDRGQGGGGRLGDELLLRRRQRAGGRGQLVADRSAPRGVGFRGHRGVGLLGRAVPGQHAPGGGRLRRRRRRGAQRGHRRRTARHLRVRTRTGGEGAPGRGARGADRPGGPAAAAPEGRARAARPRLDAGGIRGGGCRRRPRLRGQPAARAGDGRALDRAARPGERAAAARGRPAGTAPAGGRRPVRGGPAHLHGLLLLPQPRAAAPSRARSGNRGGARAGRVDRRTAGRAGALRAGLRGHR